MRVNQAALRAPDQSMPTNTNTEAVLYIVYRTTATPCRPLAARIPLLLYSDAAQSSIKDESEKERRAGASDPTVAVAPPPAALSYES